MATTPAFTVKIGSFSFNEIADQIDSEGRFPNGQPNPTQITWTKENTIKVHEIPYPAHKTSRTSKRTLWKLDLQFVVLTKENLLDKLIPLIDQVGPYFVETAFKSCNMYIQNFTTTADESHDDYRQVCSMKLIEQND
jgi:hypothetical protein